MKACSLVYALSLPERAVRSLGALAGGLLREASLLALPVKIRDAALYRATAGVGLRFLIEQVGEASRPYIFRHYGCSPRSETLLAPAKSCSPKLATR